MALVSLIFFVCALFSVSSADQSPDELCETVKQINCLDNYVSEPNEIVCASNGDTYLNRCLFVQAKCQDKDIHIVCKGNCTICASSSKSESTNEVDIRRFVSTTNSLQIDVNTPSENFQPIESNNFVNKKSTNKPSEITTVNSSVLQINRDNIIGRRLHETTTISTLDESIHNITGINITKTRKQLPGHHVDQSKETNTMDNQAVTSPTTVYTTCIGGTCTTTPQELEQTSNTTIECVTENCSDLKAGIVKTNCSSNNCVDESSVHSRGRLLHALLTPATQHIIRGSFSTPSTLLHVLTTTIRKRSNDTSILSPEASNTIVNSSNKQDILERQTTESVLLQILTPSTALVNKTAQETSPDVEFQLFCRNMDEKVCPQTLDPLCGTDNTFYLNICTFNKAKCKDGSLKLHEDLSTCRREKT